MRILCQKLMPLRNRPWATEFRWGGRPGGRGADFMPYLADVILTFTRNARPLAGCGEINKCFSGIVGRRVGFRAQKCIQMDQHGANMTAKVIRKQPRSIPKR